MSDKEISLLSLRQFVSTFTPRPLWLTWATMCTYGVQTFNFFKTGTISIILCAFENWKFKQSLTKMIARWVTWQDFPLKRKLYFKYLWSCLCESPRTGYWRDQSPDKGNSPWSLQLALIGFLEHVTCTAWHFEEWHSMSQPNSHIDSPNFDLAGVLSCHPRPPWWDTKQYHQRKDTSVKLHNRADHWCRRGTRSIPRQIPEALLRLQGPNSDSSPSTTTRCDRSPRKAHIQLSVLIPYSSKEVAAV